MKLQTNSDNILYIAEDNFYYQRDMSFQKFINSRLIYRLSNLNAVEKSTKKLFHFKTKIPLFLDRETLLMPIVSYRVLGSFYLNYFAIKSYEKIDGNIIINFINGHSMKITQEYAFKNQIIKAKTLLTYFENFQDFF